MSAETPAPAPAPGFFGLLAERQIVQDARRAPGSLRPLLPHVFDESAAVSELEPPPAPLRGHAADPRQETPATLRQERDNVDNAAPLPPPAARSTRASTTAPHDAAPREPVDRGHRLQDVSAPSRATPVPGVLPPSAPDRLHPAHGAADPRPDRVHTRERIVTLERAARAEKPTPLSPAASAASHARDVTSTGRLTPRASLPVPPFRQQRETPEPTIEIHIGRVEVRAQVAPAARTAVPETAAPDHRLATYLRKRGTGARS